MEDIESREKARITLKMIEGIKIPTYSERVENWNTPLRSLEVLVKSAVKSSKEIKRKSVVQSSKEENKGGYSSLNRRYRMLMS